jgi:hypothetical protein
MRLTSLHSAITHHVLSELSATFAKLAAAFNLGSSLIHPARSEERRAFFLAAVRMRMMRIPLIGCRSARHVCVVQPRLRFPLQPWLASVCEGLRSSTSSLAHLQGQLGAVDPIFNAEMCTAMAADYVYDAAPKCSQMQLFALWRV